MGIQLKYREVGGFDLTSTIQKIAQTPTDNRSACHIRHIVRELQKAREQITNEYQKEILEVFAKRDEKGEIVRPEGQPQGFEPLDEKMDDFVKAQDEFGNREVTVDWRPLTPSTLRDIKLSAKEIELLGPLFTEEEGPGLPNVAQLR